jgi:hypothetical protein
MADKEAHKLWSVGLNIMNKDPWTNWGLIPEDPKILGPHLPRGINMEVALRRQLFHQFTQRQE